MLFGKSKLELKVGIFVFVGVIILGIFVLSIGNFKTLTSGQRLNFIFTFVNGVKVGAPVRYAGVDVGEVKALNFLFSPDEQKTDVQAVCWVRKDVKIPRDSTVWVNTLGLLGEKYIEIMPGKDYGNFMLADSTTVGSDPLAMHEVVVLAKNIAEHLDESIVRINKEEGTIGKLLYDDTVYRELEAFVKDIRKHPWKLLIKTKEKPEEK
jgi:phospholipid/cholesterol/gamma-HCH transport system substrate-binding protein